MPDPRCPAETHHAPGTGSGSPLWAELALVTDRACAAASAADGALHAILERRGAIVDLLRAHPQAIDATSLHRVIDLDRHLLVLVEDARARVAGELRRLRQCRRALEAYAGSRPSAAAYVEQTR